MDIKTLMFLKDSNNRIVYRNGCMMCNFVEIDGQYIHFKTNNKGSFLLDDIIYKVLSVCCAIIKLNYGYKILNVASDRISKLYDISDHVNVDTVKDLYRWGI